MHFSSAADEVSFVGQEKSQSAATPLWTPIRVEASDRSTLVQADHISPTTKN